MMDLLNSVRFLRKRCFIYSLIGLDKMVQAFKKEVVIAFLSKY